MNRRFVRLGVVVVVCLVSRGVEAQEIISIEARQALDQLRREADPDFSIVVDRGRVSWASRLMVPAMGPVPDVSARELLRRHGAAFGIRDASQLEVTAQREHRGTRYVELRPSHLGLPVLGAQVIVSIRDGLVRHVASGVNAWEGPRALPTPISARAAADAVALASGRAAILPTSSDLAWLPLPGRQGRLLLVWVVSQREVAPLHDWRYVVEATTGTVLWRHDQMMRAEGYIYDTNPVTADDEVSLVELPFLDEGTEVLEGELARSYRCVAQTGDCSMRGTDCRICGEREQNAMIQEDGNFLYLPDEPNLSDPFSEVQAYYHASLVNQFFSDVLGYERQCGGSRAISIYVNQYDPASDERSANAGYGDADGDGCGDIIMGEGLGIDFAYDGEVIYHEFTHGIVEATGGLGCPPFGVCTDSLGLDPMPGGLNEGFADYFSVTISDEPTLGEHAGLAFSGDPFVRNLENDRICPFDIINEVHYDGEILGGLSWDIRELVGPEVADQMMFQALMTIVSSSGYAEVAAALSEAAQAQLEAGAISEIERDEIERLMGPEERGITDCRRIVPLDAIPDGHHEEYLMMYTFFQGIHLPGPLQWSLTTPRRALELQFQIEDYGSSAGSVVAHIRRDEPVDVEMEFIQEEMRLELDFIADASFDVTREALMLTPETELPIEGETTYYIALEFECPYGCLIRPTGDVIAAENQAPIAAAGDDQEVEQWDTVVLDGSASSDPDGDELTYSWVKLSGPPIELADADTSQATFVAENAGTLELELTVTDREGEVGQDSVIVTVSSEPSQDSGPLGEDAGADGGGGDGDLPPPVMSVSGGTCDCAASGGARDSLGRLLEIVGF